MKFILLHRYSILPVINSLFFAKFLGTICMLLFQVIQKLNEIMIEMKLLCYIMESTVDSYEKRNTINKTACQ